MEKSSHVQVGYPKSDIDFHDVFGGPPRRSSMQDMQFVNSYVSDDDDEMNKWRSSWSGVREKPVFGDENVNRRRYTSDYFFDDIFKGQQQQPLSSPASRMLSPARPSPPQAEPLSPSSHPAQFSLPANLPKGVDLPAFGASALSSYKMINGTSIGTNPSSPNMSPPSFSGDVIDSHGELIDDVRSYRPSPLSHEISVSSEGSPTSMKSDKSDIGEKSKKDFDFGNMKNGSQFHFSIYKWASKGVPSMVPVRTGRSSRLKEKSKLERSSSFRNWILNKNLAAENPRDQSSTTVTKTSETDARSLECEKQQNELLPDASSENTVETQQMVQEADPLISKRVIMESTPSGGDSPGSSILKNAEQIEESDSLTEKVVSKKNEREISAEVLKHESKTRHSLFHTKKDRQGISRKSSKTEVKEDKGKAKKKSSIVAAKPKNQDGKGCTQTTEEVDKSILEDSSIDKGDNGGMRKVKGKVKDFVKVFNQDASPNSKINTDSGSKSFRRTRKNTSKKEKESKVETSETDDKPCMPNGNSKSMSTGASIKVDEYLRESDNHHGATKTNDDILHYSSAGQKGSSVSNTATVPDMSDASVKVSEEYFSGNFQVNELHQAEDELLQKNKTQEETQAIDAKIRKWSNGKEGNIRSMLSTLQYVLWPESGWKPVPLVDIIEGNAVKKAYQKALLCLHPDKLQQKGAASHQKYTAEKVFDILQEAWNQFNSFNPL